MAIKLLPLSLPASADPIKFAQFGREVQGVNPGELTKEEFEEIKEALYTYDALLFRNVDLSPDKQYALTKAFDPESNIYGHGNHGIDKNPQSILHFYVNTIPKCPQVQLIGHGTVRNHEGIPEVTLKHGHHASFHKTSVPKEDEAKGVTRFFRWHMDAALYDLDPPRVTTLYGIQVPKGPMQTVRYDDGTGDELPVPLGATAFVSGKTIFETLPREMKSLAVRTRVKYAPHPFEWMSSAHALPTGLGLETEGLEKPYVDLSPWENEKVKVYPMLWKNHLTGELHFQVHPCAVNELFVDPLPAEAQHEGALYPDGAHISDLKEVRDICYRMQRPGIAPSLVYPHNWQEKDLMLFHNRGVMHSVVGVFKEGQVRIFHQCNLAASDEVAGPSKEDIDKWA